MREIEYSVVSRPGYGRVIVTNLGKQKIAQQMLDHYKWCAFHDIEIFGDFVKCLGYQCRKELVAEAVNGGSIERVIESMTEIGN